nr:hypothetical protein [Tanacetum cinerariifolium]
MNLLIVAQVALDEVLVSTNDHVTISNSNMRIDQSKTQKEATYQVVLDTLKLSPCYNAFLITADVPEIYMQQLTLDSLNRSLLNRLLMKKLSLSSKKLVTNEIYNISLSCILITCVNHGEPLLQSLTAVSLGKPQLTNSNYQELKSYEIDKRQTTTTTTRRVNMPYPRLKFVAKNKDNQVYDKTIPDNMVFRGIKESTAYKTYFAFSTKKVVPKKARKGSKAASQPMKAISVTASDDSDPEPAKKPTRKRKPASVVIKRTPDVSKKKTLVQSEKHKGVEMLSEAALLEEAQKRKALKLSRRETSFRYQTRGSSEGAGSKLEVLNEPKGKSVETSEGAGSKLEVLNEPKGKSVETSEGAGSNQSEDDDDDRKSDDERTKSDDDKSIDLNKTDNEEESQRDEFELYDDVNVEMKDVEPTNEGKGDEEMTDAEKVDVEHEKINQEVASAQVQDEVQATTTTALATQKEKTDVPPSSSSRSASSNNVIPEPIVIKPPKIVTAAPAITIHAFIPISQQSTPIPTTTTTKATTSTIAVPGFETLSATHLRVSNLEKEVRELKHVDHPTTPLATIRSELPSTVKEYLGTNLGDAVQKVLQRHTAKLIQEHFVPADVVAVLKQQQEPQISAADIQKIKMEHETKHQEHQYTTKSSVKDALKEFDQK